MNLVGKLKVQLKEMIGKDTKNLISKGREWIINE